MTTLRLVTDQPARPSEADKEWARNQFRSWANEPSTPAPIRTIQIIVHPSTTDTDLADIFSAEWLGECS